MSAPHRPLVIAAGRGERAAWHAASLAAAMPDAVLMSDDAGGPTATGDPDALWGWLASGGVRPSVRRKPATRLRTTPWRAAPRDGIVVAVGLSAWEGKFPALLARRPDLVAVALLDEPTALDWPEFTPPGEVAATRRALDALSRFAPPIMASSREAADRLAAHLPASGGRLIIEPCPSALAGTAPEYDPMLAGAPYLVAAGPLEPRGNTVLLLQLWRDALVRGLRLPKLVLAGPRGSQIEEIAPLLDWNDALRATVAEAPGLHPAALRRLIENARALLVPDFADPPVALARDARMLDVPVIAAASPAMADLDLGPRLDPLDGPGWRARIIAASQRPRVAKVPVTLPAWSSYAGRVVAGLEALIGESLG